MAKQTKQPKTTRRHHAPEYRALRLSAPKDNREAFELIYNARYRPRRSQSLYRGDVFDAVG